MMNRVTIPPPGLMARLHFYSARYGIVHALFRYIFSRHRTGWRYVGPWVTAGYRKKWLASAPKRIVNLGGGGNCLEGCLTVDVDPRADSYVDLTKPLPFDDESIDAIFCEEAIEHVTKEEGARLLAECIRVLRRGAVLRLTTPDLDYLAADLGADEGTDAINQMFYEHGHRYLYSRAALMRACELAGFVNLTASTHKDPRSQLGYLDTHAERYGHKPEVAQFLEATKPAVS
jgi:predicted SAM-dependent methyltransferase